MMNIFKTWWAGKEEDYEKRQEERKARFSKMEEIYTTKVVKSENEMTARNCPFMNFEQCRFSCVHFQNSYYVSYDFDGRDYFRFHDARCKLWSK